MLRSFINAEGKLVLCNEPFFTHFGHCTQHLIGKSVDLVFSTCKAEEILQAVNECKSHPEQSFTVEMEKACTGGCNFFRWEIFAEQQGGRVTGIHLIGHIINAEKKNETLSKAALTGMSLA